MKSSLPWAIRVPFLILFGAAIAYLWWTDPRRCPPSPSNADAPMAGIARLPMPSDPSMGTDLTRYPRCRDLAGDSAATEIDTGWHSELATDTSSRPLPGSLRYRLRKGKRVIHLNPGGCWLHAGDPIDVVGSISPSEWVDIYTEGKGFYGDDKHPMPTVPVEEAIQKKFGRWLEVVVGGRSGKVFSAGLDPVDPFQEIEGSALLEQLPGYFVECEEPPDDGESCQILHSGASEYDFIELVRTPYQAQDGGLDWREIKPKRRAWAMAPLFVMGDGIGGPAFHSINWARREGSDFVLGVSELASAPGDTSSRMTESEIRISREDGLWRLESAHWPRSVRAVESGRMLEHRIMESMGSDESSEPDRCVNRCH